MDTSCVLCVNNVCVGWETQTGKDHFRAKGRPGKYYSPGKDDRVRGSDKRREKKERDPRRDVTLPNHQDGGKARSDSKGSSDIANLPILNINGRQQPLSAGDLMSTIKK